MRADLLFEDYLVAKSRFLAARRRARKAAADTGVPLRDQQKHAAPSRSPDVKIHGDGLRAVLLAFWKLDDKNVVMLDPNRGVQPRDPGDPQWARARRIAAARLRGDKAGGGCLCSNPACPARPARPSPRSS